MKFFSTDHRYIMSLFKLCEESIMSILRYRTNSLLNEFDRLLGQQLRLNTDEDDTSNVETSHWSPAIDIKENDKNFQIIADLPGIDKKDITNTMVYNVLTNKGERNEEKTEEQQNYKRIERLRGRFYRRFTLPDTANGNDIQASMKRGVLEITIPKLEQAKSKLIDVQIHD